MQLYLGICTWVLAWASVVMGAGCRGNFDPIARAEPMDAPMMEPIDAPPMMPIDAPPIDAPSIPPPPPILRACEVHLRFDEVELDAPSGKLAADSCGGDDNAAPELVQPHVDAIRGKVVSFDGTASLQIADVPRLRGGRTLTFSAWVKPMGEIGELPYPIIAKRAGYNAQSAYTMFLWDDPDSTEEAPHMWADIDGVNDRAEVPVTILSDQWVHLTVVYDGSILTDQRLKTYINGAPAGTFLETSPQIPLAYDAPLTIGKMPDPAYHFQGLMDDVTIWSRALTDDEVEEWHARTTPTQ